MKRTQSLEQIHCDLASRYRLIKTVGWWEGRPITTHLMQGFGISRRQASKISIAASLITRRATWCMTSA